MYNWIMTVMTIVIAAIGVYHSWLKHRNFWYPLTFFGGGFLFGIIRENIVQSLVSLYSYPGYYLYIFNAPLFMGFGWSVAFYIGLEITYNIFDGLKIQKDNILLVALSVAIFSALLGFAIEITAVQAEWWIWYIPAFYMGMPLIVPFGWGGAAFIFLSIFLYLERKNLPENKFLLYFYILVPVIIFLHMGYVVLVRNLLMQFGL